MQACTRWRSAPLERRLGPAPAVVFDPQRGHRRGLVFSGRQDDRDRRHEPGADGNSLGEGLISSLGGGNRHSNQPTKPALRSYIHAASYSPDRGTAGRLGGIGQNSEGQVVLWDTKTWKIQMIMTPGKVVQPVTAVKCLVFAPDGKTFAVGGAGGMLSIRAVDSRD